MTNVLSGVVRLSARHPWQVLGAFLVLTLVSIVGMLRLEYENDVFVFLPENDPDVRLFRSVSRDFGALRVVLVGVQAKDDEDVLVAPAVEALADADKAFREAAGVARVLSIASVADVVTGPNGAEITHLVSALPASDAEHVALRQKVLSRDHVRGSLIAEDARSAVFMIYVLDGAPTAEIVDAVRGVAGRELQRFHVYFGGAPFAADAIYGEARRDVRNLSPIAAAVLVLAVLLSFRDVIGVVLTLWSVGLGTLTTLGLMGFLGERHTALTATLPVLLLAAGSAYPIHMLGRYYLERETHRPDVALRRAAKIVARPLAIAAWTTSVAFLSFLVMDVRPMRAFGLEVAFGTLVCWSAALTLVPAVLTLKPRAPQREQLLPFGAGLVALWRLVARRRREVGGALVVVGLLAVLPIRDVTVRSDPRAFFRPDSEPWRADRFFEERFGGARFVQIAVDGDMEDPATLREVDRIITYAMSLPDVTSVTSLLDSVVITSDVLGGTRRLPLTRAQAAQIYLFLEGETGISSVVTTDHRKTLIHVRVRNDAAPVISALERFVENELRAVPGAPSKDDIGDRAAWLLSAYGDVAVVSELRELVSTARLPDDTDPAWAAARTKSVERFLLGEDGPEATPEEIGAMVRAFANGGDVKATLTAILGSKEEGDYWAEQTKLALDDDRLRFARDRLVRGSLGAARLETTDASLAQRLEVVMDDAFATGIAPASTPITAHVTGEPVLDRAFSRSVARNQLRAMAVGLVTVFALIVVLFRSWAAAVACVVPAALTAGILGGIMGLMDVQIDIGTAMVGAILTDTASDFGMHYLWYLKYQKPDEVSRSVGPVMLVSSGLVALGFFAFAVGDSTVMRLFGVLSGATCVLSAALTCLLVPVAWPWLAPRLGAQAPSGD